ncbi:SDR family oxidoreductase [Lewinella cohaerens]|uniref:SDR family oxidoreductase n=1 Tax=Lewinella cohaerens TaxID=70995 RepID=UPI00035E725C|nr:SDR family oxidoreductase [Lewinella cohaerens]
MQTLNIPVSLAYCVENEEIANKIAADLASIISLQKVAIQRDQEQSLASVLKGFEGAIILLVSDNFLRSTKCMEQGLSMLNEHGHDLLPVVIPGYRLQENGEKEEVATSFERVTDIIQYINFWQDRYLDLRRQKREDNSLNSESFATHLKTVRDISGEAGEFIRLLRSNLHLELYQFQHNAYEQLFIFLDETDAGDVFRATFAGEPKAITPEEIPAVEEPTEEVDEAPPIDLTGIPGINLLPPTPADDEEEPEEVPDSQEDHVVVDKVEDFGIEVLEGEPEEHPKEEEEPDLEALEGEPEESTDDIEDEVGILIEKAWRLADSSSLTDGITLLEAGLESFPNNEELLYNYALLLAQDDQPKEAIEQVNFLLTKNPQHENGLFLAGELADLAGKPALARKYFARLVRINEQGADVWFRLGELSLQAEPDATEKAVKYFKEAAKREGTPEDAYYQLGLLYAGALDHPKKALKAFKKTIGINPEHAFVHYDLALLYHRQKEHEQAFHAYQQAISINPELKTPENDTVFKLMAHKSDLQQEQNTLQALKDNVQRLEALIQQREASALLESEVGKGKCILITGATSGIGRATATKFAANGYRLIITGRRKERLEALQQEWEERYGTESYLLVFDVRSAEAVQNAIDSLPSEWSDIDILMNNAGKAKGFDPIHEGHLEHWDEMIDTNIKGLLYLTRAVTPGMVARRQGHVINVASTAGKEVYPKGNVYCATKFAVDALTKSMRLDLHRHDIRVSQVAPAHVEETEFALVRFDGDQEKANIYEGFQPLTSRDVAETVFFIAQQPAHVNILDVVLQGTQQASSTVIDRSGRDKYQEEE